MTQKKISRLSFKEQSDFIRKLDETNRIGREAGITPKVIRDTIKRVRREIQEEREVRVA